MSAETVHPQQENANPATQWPPTHLATHSLPGQYGPGPQSQAMAQQYAMRPHYPPAPGAPVPAPAASIPSGQSMPPGPLRSGSPAPPTPPPAPPTPPPAPPTPAMSPVPVPIVAAPASNPADRGEVSFTVLPTGDARATQPWWRRPLGKTGADEATATGLTRIPQQRQRPAKAERQKTTGPLRSPVIHVPQREKDDSLKKLLARLGQRFIPRQKSTSPQGDRSHSGATTSQATTPGMAIASHTAGEKATQHWQPLQPHHQEPATGKH